MRKIEIRRFGKMLPLVQKDNYGKDGFHSAPEKEGFYVFPLKGIELFLAGHVLYENDFYGAEIVGGTVWIHTKPKKQSMILKEYNQCWYKVYVSDYFKIIEGNYYPNDGSNRFPKMRYSKDFEEIFCTKETIIKNVLKLKNKYKERKIKEEMDLLNI